MNTHIIRLLYLYAWHRNLTLLPGGTADVLFLETGDGLLLETGDFIVLE